MPDFIEFMKLKNKPDHGKSNLNARMFGASYMKWPNHDAFPKMNYAEE